MSITAAAEYAYVKWLAQERGLSIDEATQYARRPRRWGGYRPTPPRPVICVDDSNVVTFPPRRRRDAPEAA